MTDKNTGNERTKLVDIAIVGGGMVGASLAASLKETRVSIALIDGQSETQLSRAIPLSTSANGFEPRVSALTPASRNLLKSVGAWELISPEQIMPYQKMSVWDHLGTASIHFDAAELYQDTLGYIVENQNIVSALHACLKGQRNLNEFYGVNLEQLSKVEGKENEHRLELADGQVVQCKLLIAADGANSRIRSWAGMPTREWDYQHQAIVATVKTSKKHCRTCWQRFSETGPIAFLPLQDGQASERFCSIVWSQCPDRAKELMSLSNEEFSKVLSSEIEDVLGSVEEVSERYAIPLRQRHAKSYIKPGIALMGDAAHTIHPLAGQGVNLGFKDVVAFSEVLGIADKNELDVNHEVLLRRYQRQRQGDNLMMMSAMEGFKRLFEQTDPFVRLARNMGLNWVDKQSFIKNQLAKHAMGLTI